MLWFLLLRINVYDKLKLRRGDILKHLDSCIDRLINERTVENIAVKIGKGDDVLYEIYRSENTEFNKYTLFDMASVTKIIATTSLSLIALDRGILSLDNTVADFFPCNREKESITIFNLLTHTIGIGHKSLNIEGNTYENIAEYILQIPCDIPIGSDVIYSCPGFVLLGKILEKVFEKTLDVLFDELVCKPLGMNATGFCPQNKTNAVNSNLNENLLGVVNDYNCRFLGGIAGNAGVFSNMNDLTSYVTMLLRKGYPIISENTFEKAVHNYTENMSESRGLGFLYVDERFPQTGNLFPTGCIGHCGHTGQSVFVDIKSGLYVIILSDATVSTVKKFGKENYPEVMKMRADIHNAIKVDLEAVF